MKRDLLSLHDLSSDEIHYIIDLALKLKNSNSKTTDHLKNKAVGLLFQKPSNRTRVSFEIAIWQLGGKCLYLAPQEINLGKRESVSDVAKTLSRYLDCIVARTFSHADVVELAENASAIIINGLSDLFHPCQALADILTVKEKFGNKKKALISYIGDGNNVCNSLILACARVGYDLNIATPKHYAPNQGVLDIAHDIAKKTKSTISIFNNPREAVSNADVIYSDVWVSMGQEEEDKKRKKDFKRFQINANLVKYAQPNYIFMHCLPAHRGMEVSADVIDGPNSVVFDQAENRMHVQKAILTFLLASPSA
ncbi:MAG: ornithine carbamoyltransferase [Candidatus Omnitrophica bacterium]|nr:ornithine carbamoyltransferase [Candidatus Omnitrophota bacterium]